MKKKLLTESIANELEGASLFFTRSAPTPPSKAEPFDPKPELKAFPPATSGPEPKPTEISTAKKVVAAKNPQTERDTVIPRHHGTMTPRYHDTTVPRVHGVVIELVRKAVKDIGKEAATHRFTADEKKEMADLIYTYKSRGVKTSENEIARIAINFVVQDYRENGEGSVLHKILEALNE